MSEDNEFPNLFEVPEHKPEEQQDDGERKLKPFPIADPKLTRKICDLMQQLSSLKQLKKGVNEVLKELHKNKVEVVILAANCEPLEVIMTLPPICEQTNVQYCFVPDKALLGRVCGISRPVVAAAIIAKEGSQLTGQITELKDRIERLFI